MKASISGIMAIALWLGSALAALAQAQTPTPAQNAAPIAASSSEHEEGINSDARSAPWGLSWRRSPIQRACLRKGRVDDPLDAEGSG